MRCDIFCRVVDNFGDIGVCWRLARQLRREHRYEVRLWVDDLHAFQRLRADVDPDAGRQTVAGISVLHWRDPLPTIDRLDLVVEAFGCPLPQAVLDQMAGQQPKPVWVNLEYLSAEAWVEACHRLPSPQPQLPLKQYFFFPGFTAATGGLLRERDLIERRDRFVADRAAQIDFWRGLALPPPDDDEIRLSLFSYENPALKDLLAHWAQSPHALSCVIPEGKAMHSVNEALDGSKLMTGSRLRVGKLTLYGLPFLETAQYDYLLWACSFNIVRGEDSFVRAQWAGKPLLWHIYPQDDAAHWDKLNAFLARYTEDGTKPIAERSAALMREFNAGSVNYETWDSVRRDLSALSAHSVAWADQLAQHEDLASQLAKFHQACVK